MRLKWKKITIIGLGLIGGSLAKAIKKRKLAFSLSGLAHRQASLSKLKKMPIFDQLTLDLKTALSGADLVILAAPVGAIEDYLTKIRKFIAPGCLVMDVGSVKESIVKKGKKALGDNFVGTHPLAGSEKKGIDFAQADLFKSSLVVVVPSHSQKNNRRIKEFWQALGAKVVFMEAEAHDEAIAFTSHLPHLLAFSLIGALPKGLLRYEAGSLRDITRVAKSHGVLWADVFSANEKKIKKAFIRLKKEAEYILKLAREKKALALFEYIDGINRKLKP